MKEVKSLLKLVADGLKTLAQGVEAIADKVDEASKSKSMREASVETSAESVKQAPPKRATAGKNGAGPAKKAPSAEKPAAKPPPKKAAEAVTAVDTVMAIIGSSTKGVSTADIKSKTGYNQKKVANIVYKLKKKNRIKSIDKGVYVKL
jgi:hypothetical protein